MSAHPSHGLLRIRRAGRGSVLVCECGWESVPRWPSRKNMEKQVTQLREHVIGTWRREG